MRGETENVGGVGEVVLAFEDAGEIKGFVEEGFFAGAGILGGKPGFAPGDERIGFVLSLKKK